MPELLQATVHGAQRRPTVLLLHSLALDGSVWSPVVDLLVATAAVVTLDLTGHGRSPRATALTVERMADDVAATMTAIGRSSAVVVGMSLGGSVAQALAAGYPEQVSALGLVDTTAWYGPSAQADWEGRADKARTAGMKSLRDFQLERWFTPDFVQREPGVCARLLEIFEGNDLNSYVAACRALGAMDLRDRLGSLRMPTAVVVGEQDQATPVSAAEAIADRVSQAKLTVLPHGRHLTAIEQPDAVLDALGSVLP
jgi:3-oxoadipate enol-lactonase